MADDLRIGDGAGPRTLLAPTPRREGRTGDRVRDAEFPTALRGYDRDAVDGFMAEVADLVDALEARQARETVVQRALEEVGEETSAILKQAHESADDITARSRSQAEDRVERAREEAAQITREAEQLAIRLDQETLTLREERSLLIEDLRRLSADALTLAEGAEGRVDPPAAPVATEEEAGVPYDTAADLAAEPPVGEGPGEPSAEPVEEPTEDPTEELRSPR